MKNRKISLIVVFVFLTTLLSLAIWFLKEENKPKVIVVVRRIDSEYWKLFESGVKKAFQDFGIRGQVLAPESQYPISTQPNLLKQVLKQNPDALVVAPTVPSAVYPVLMEYKERNIPVFITNTSVDWEYKTAYIGTDNIKLGETAGMLLGSMLQPGDQVAIIHGRVNDGISITRKNSAKKVLEDIGVEVVAEEVGYDRLKKPIPVIGDILQTYPNLKGVVATTDRLALKALQGIEEKQLNIPVVGSDGIVSMVETVEEGKITATIGQNPYDAGYLSVAQAHKKFKGENINLRVDSGTDIITKDTAEKKLDFLQENSKEE